MKIYKINILTLWTLVLLVLLQSCAEDPDFERPTGVKPNKIDKIAFEALSGKAKVIVNTKQPEDYVYTRIDFEIRENIVRSIKLSKYEDFTILEGFARSGKHKIKLTPVSIGEVEGESNEFEIEVLIPPYQVVKNKLNPIFTFSGIRVDYENPESDPLSLNIATFKKDEQKIITKNRKQIKTQAGKEFFLGLPSVEDTFYIYVSDRWGNISDTIIMKGTPWNEIELDKNQFREFAIPNEGDDIRYNSNYPMRKMWDKVIGSNNYLSCYFTKANALNEINNKTANFSINVGKKAMLSRFKIHHYYGSSSYVFRGATPKTFALYGSNNPSTSESLDDWTLIQDFSSVRPSNMSTAELIAYAHNNGEDFIFDETPPPYKYYKFTIKSVWEGWSDVAIDELTLFGNYEN